MDQMKVNQRERSKYNKRKGKCIELGRMRERNNIDDGKNGEKSSKCVCVKNMKEEMKKRRDKENEI